GRDVAINVARQRLSAPVCPQGRSVGTDHVGAHAVARTDAVLLLLDAALDDINAVLLRPRVQFVRGVRAGGMRGAGIHLGKADDLRAPLDRSIDIRKSPLHVLVLFREAKRSRLYDGDVDLHCPMTPLSPKPARRAGCRIENSPFRKIPVPMRRAAAVS